MRGVAIPGLGMTADELPFVPGIERLENPEIGDGQAMAGDSYSLADVAAIHAQAIAEMAHDAESFWVLGMSMGGMIAAILASDLRAMLPRQTRFALLVTSANVAANPAISDARLREWTKARPGSAASFGEVMAPFFSENFRSTQPETAAKYYEFRASGANRQSPKAFMRQVAALRKFDGERHFAALNPSEVTIISGIDDYVLDTTHQADMRRLVPNARHIALPGVGHMINLEYPAAFEPWKLWP